MTNQSPPDEFRDWRQHPFTQRFFQFLSLRREQNKEDWAKGMHEGENLQDWALKNAKALGGVAVIDALIDLEMSDILQSEKEAHEYIRNQSGRLDGTRQAV